MKEIEKQIYDVENQANITFPKLYTAFLKNIPKENVYDIAGTGICFYSYSDLIERNDTYEIKEYDPNFFMIGQDGDLGYFINAKNANDESIYSNDLGAIGSLPMKKEAHDIQEFISKYQ